MTRFRENDFRVDTIGSYTSPIGPTTVYATKTDGLWETCEDIVGNYMGVNNLQITKRLTYYPTLDGNNGAGRSYNGYPIGYRPGAIDPRGQFPAFTTLDKNSKAWQILAETNPSVPHVSVPSFVGELKDIPDLIKGWGSNLLNKIASGALTWRWAIKPMISDLRKMLNFVKAVDNRMAWLMHLREGRVLRRRCTLSKTTITGNRTAVFLHTQGAGINGWTTVRHTSEVWGSAEWKLDPSSDIPRQGYGELERLSKELAAGITTHEALATIWELTPWSWLADWCSDVGNIIAATNNSLPCTHGNICLMRTSFAERCYELNVATSATWPIINGWYIERFLRKERHVVAPTIPVVIPHLPILDGGKWSILASLAAVKASSR